MTIWRTTGAAEWWYERQSRTTGKSRTTRESQMTRNKSRTTRESQAKDMRDKSSKDYSRPNPCNEMRDNSRTSGKIPTLVLAKNQKLLAKAKWNEWKIKTKLLPAKAKQWNNRTIKDNWQMPHNGIRNKSEFKDSWETNQSRKLDQA